MQRSSGFLPGRHEEVVGEHAAVGDEHAADTSAAVHEAAAGRRSGEVILIRSLFMLDFTLCR